MAARKALAPQAGDYVTDGRTPLALGGTALGNLYAPVTDEDAKATIDAAWDEGIRHFDVAPQYGHGEAETRLGRALAGRSRDEFVISTKVGRLIRKAEPTDAQDPFWNMKLGTKTVFDFSYDGVMRSVEGSLERLGVDRIDILYLHDPDVEGHYDAASTSGYRALDALRSEGSVRAIGVGMTRPGMLEDFAASGTYDYFLLATRHSLLHAHDSETLLAVCEENGVGVIVGSVFNSGILAAPTADATYDYAPAPAAVLRRAQRMQELCREHGVPLPAAALQFPARHPAVCSVLVGARTPEEIRVDAEFFREPIPDELWSELAKSRYGADAL